MNNIKLTYIASAVTSFARVQGILALAKKVGRYDEYHRLLQDIMFKLNSYSEHVDLGTLWNALTEKSHKDILINLTNNGTKQLMTQADSGGLQMITLGLKSDDKTKDDIYKRQAEYSTHAMSFDKMPILVDESKRHTVSSQGNGAQGMKMNHSLKYFVRELRYDAGRESGFNIKRQIDVFKENNSKSKVLTIIQGWDIEDYNEYARGLFSVFNEMSEKERNSYYEYIGGISLGTSGIISYFRMFDLYCRAPIDLVEVPEQFRSLIHILGLGGPSKSGILFALQDNFFGKEVHYTFDSTSHTSASTFGKMTTFDTQRNYLNDSESKKMMSCKLGRKISDDVKLFMKEIQDEYEELLIKNLGYSKMTTDEFRNNFSPWRDDGRAGIKDFTSHFGTEKGSQIYLDAISVNSFLHFAIEYKKYIEITEEFRKGDFHSIGDKEYRKAMKKLSTIKNYKEYMEQREWFKLVLGNKRPSTMTLVETVEEFEKLCNMKGLEDEW